MIQYLKLMGDRGPGLLEVLNGPDDLGILHVADWVVIKADGQDARVAALRRIDY